MKIKLLSALIATAFAGVATTASAGVIQASYKNFASEVFGNDTLSLVAPTINYGLALPLSGTAANPNTFTAAWTLVNGGEWTIAPATTAVRLTDPSNAFGQDAASVTLSADKKTISAVFLLNTGAAYPVGSQIILGQGSPATITKIGTLLGAPAQANTCNDDTASADVAIKMTNAAGVEFDTNFPGASNTTPIALAKVAISVKPQSSQAYSAATPALNELSKVDVLQPSLGKFFTNPADITNSNVIVNLGAINITDKSSSGLFDLGGGYPYSVKNQGAGPPLGAQGVNFGTNPNTVVGVIEAQSLKVDVSGNFLTSANGGAFYTSLASNCIAPVTTGTIAADGKSATVTTTPLTGLANAAGATPMFLCYSTTGTKTILTGQFQVTGGSLSKFANTAEVANPVCAGPVLNLGSNGVKVDVRNYIPQVATNASGWFSVVRVINTDEQQNVSPVITALLASGVLGSSTSLDPIVSTNGKSGPFAPREVRYYTTSALDAALNAAATPANPSYGAADVGGNARLRITAPSSSLRVQNYIYNPATGNFVEASAAQSDEGPEGQQLNSQNNR